jgi:PhnB protein
MSVKPKPDNYHSITPYLVVQDASALMDFLQKAFNAIDREVHKDPQGRIMHAEMQIGDSVIMMGEAMDRPVMHTGFYLYVPDTDTVYAKALAAGGATLLAPVNQFYGDRNAGVTDPFGNQWWIATHIEDVSDDELQKRMSQRA